MKDSLRNFLLGCIFTTVCTLVILSKRHSPTINTPSDDFATGVKLGYYIHSKGGTKDDINTALLHWNNGHILTFIRIFDNDHPRNTQATN